MHPLLQPFDSAQQASSRKFGSRAAVRYLNLVGDRYLELTEGPGSTRILAPGSQIPLDHTAPALDLDLRARFRILDVLVPLLLESGNPRNSALDYDYPAAELDIHSNKSRFPSRAGYSFLSFAERGRIRTSDALFSAYRLLQTGALDHSATSPKTIPISPLSSRLRAYTDQRPPINVKNRMRSGIVSEDSHTSFGENCNQ